MAIIVKQITWSAILHPEDGYIQQADLTQAMAKEPEQEAQPYIEILQFYLLDKLLKVAGRLRPIKGNITCDHGIGY